MPQGGDMSSTNPHYAGQFAEVVVGVATRSGGARRSMIRHITKRPVGECRTEPVFTWVLEKVVTEMHCNPSLACDRQLNQAGES
jgi:hypothetical protein